MYDILLPPPVSHFPLLFLLLLVACKRPQPSDDTASASPPVTTASGSALTQSTPPPSTADGEKLFQQHCATCHMANGSGVPFLQPDIRKSAWISAEDPQPLLKLILRGSAAMGEFANAYENDMPPFEHLSDADIAALATRVRERFTTPPPAKPITPADVATARQQ